MAKTHENGYLTPATEILDRCPEDSILVASTVDGSENYGNGGTIDDLFE